jgi:CubicO group peptidase (beta-lactamase class C family)
MKWPLTILAILLVSCSRSAREAGSPQSGDAELQALLNKRAAQAGAGVAIVAGILDEKGRRMVVGKGEQAGVVDGDTIFEIGSVTKVFTGLLLAVAVSRNEVKLDDSISKFLPASVNTPERNGRQITLLDLATHSSALSRLPDNMVPKDAENPYADYSVKQMYDFLSDFKPARDIGAEYEYSNLGAGLLGHILALKAGTNYEALVLERICQPLGMTNTLITLSPALKKRLAPGHDASGAPARNWDLPTFAGAGALRSTVNDLLTFLSANLELHPATLAPAMRLAQEPRRDAGAQMKIGLGWHIAEKHDAKIVWHNGGTGGYHSFIGFNPATRRAVVLLANSAHSFDDIGFHLLESKYSLAGAESAKGRTVLQLKPEILDRYVGRYQLAPGAFFNLRRDGNRLLAQLTGQSYIEIYPESETNFFYKVVDAQITFHVAGGRTTELVLHQNGIDQTAKKISDEPPKERQAVKLDPKVYDRCVGEYELGPGAVFTIRKEGDRLMARLTGQSFLEILPESETEFFYKEVDAQITFVKNGQGSIIELVLHQSGRDLRAKGIR